MYTQSSLLLTMQCRHRLAAVDLLRSGVVSKPRR